MATRSHIGIKQANGSIKYIYCHWDGYPEHNGVILKEHYTTEAKVNELMDLGDISSLGEDIDKCVAYGRDRGETGVEARTDTMKDFIGQEYNYLFENGEWKCF